MRPLFVISWLLVLMVAPVPSSAADRVADAYAALLAEFDEEGGVRQYAPRFLDFAKENIESPVAIDALFWVVQNVRGRRETAQAIQLLEQHHVTHAKLAGGCRALAASRTVGAEKLLRAILEKNPDRQVRAVAGYYLASLLDREATILEQLSANPKLAPRVLQYYGKEYGAHLAALDAATLADEREKVYQRLLEDFADVQVEERNVGKLARDELFAIRHLAVGRVAPEIKGVDIDGDEFKLSDYRGKVVMLSFWGHW